jgi:hypothetical protein
MASTLWKGGSGTAAQDKDETDTQRIISGVTLCRTYPWSNRKSMYQEEN